LDLLNKAESIEKSLFDKRVKLADEEVRIAREAIAIKAGFNSKEIQLLKQTGDATKELAESKGGLYDEEYDRLNKARIARIALEDESTSNLEKNFNKQEALAQKQEDERQKRIDDQKASADKQKADRLKAQEDAKKAQEDEDKRKEEKIKSDAEKAIALDEEIKQAQLDVEEFSIKKAEEKTEREDAESANRIARIINESDEEKRLAEEKINLENQVKDAKLDIANQTLELIGTFAKKGSKLAKGVAVAQATMSTYQGITNAFSAPSTVPEPFGMALRIANASVIGASGFANVKNILATNESGTGGGGQSSGVSAPSVSAPSFNLVQGTGTNQIAQGLAQQGAPIKAYVVSSDVSTSQSLDRNIVSEASLG